MEFDKVTPKLRARRQHPRRARGRHARRGAQDSFAERWGTGRVL